MSMNETALYGQLVEYLRDQWVEQSAQFNESSLAEERARIDEIIRKWFFTPQDELSGLTPREMIRNDEQGKPNTVPHNHLGDIFSDDCPLCQMMKDGLLGDGEWHIGLAPDMSLLDEYDPEGYEDRWRDETVTPAANTSPAIIDADKEPTNAPAKEARTWLMQNGSKHCFAGNRFYDRQEALDFVNRLYDLGALLVMVDNILDEPYRLREQGGPYADTLEVYLPPEAKGRNDLRSVFEHELSELQGLDLDKYQQTDLLVFWWD
jgi:hypothetical protein